MSKLIICIIYALFYRYFSWYSDPGQLDIIVPQLASYLKEWRSKYPDKLFLMTEYGGDTISGKTIKHINMADLGKFHQQLTKIKLDMPYCDQKSTYTGCLISKCIK